MLSYFFNVCLPRFLLNKYLFIYLTKNSEEDIIKLKEPFNLHLYHLLFCYLK